MLIQFRPNFAPLLLRGLTWVKCCAWTQNHLKNFGACPGLPFQLISLNQNFQNYRPECTLNAPKRTLNTPKCTLSTVHTLNVP